MKYVASFFWIFILAHMITYIGVAMTGGEYSASVASTLGVVGSLLIFMIANVLPNDPLPTVHH